ncbi:ScbA/BarX family gamma-butyrolactone biosynthesis protein [Streptomyces sp. NPDC000594]|uniref:ScbA/BarX family gamma-butyrolactone biosynthesis protein n=1 Tax=Streptomyces sp. NPDC000594 TaxID=3154261 RepID=UPI00332E02ED
MTMPLRRESLAVVDRPVAHGPFTTTVPREYVHRAALAEVFLTGLHPTGLDSLTVTAQWPRAHTFYGPTAGFHDPLMFVETLRQAVHLITHTVYAAPMDHHQIWRRLTVDLDRDALAVGETPAAVELDIRCAGVERRAGALRGLRMEVTARRDGRFLGSAVSGVTSLPRTVYRRLRGPHAEAAAWRPDLLPPPVQPALVGRSRPEDVVLAPTPVRDRWLLRADTRHPILFDHPQDHAPGMLLLEAARQAALAVSPPVPVVPVGTEAVFHRYAELDADCWIEAVPAAPDARGNGRTRVVAVQHDACLFESVVTTVPAREGIQVLPPGF